MTTKLFILACLIMLLPPAAAMAQDKGYKPFPAGFEKLDEPSKQIVLDSIEKNTDIYLRSPEYRKAIANFVAEQNPEDMNSCAKLEMDKGSGKNTIKIDDPLLFAKSYDKHPLVGKWQHKATLIGCDKVFTFTIMTQANKAQSPNMQLK